jgi:DNA invertase Pin-like site-specific DNA recombinase
MVKKTVIYARYSSDMQRKESCPDQERNVRTGLARKSIDTSNAFVLHDEAESGTKADRELFEQLRAMIARGEVGILAVDDQSRLTRADNAFSFIQDLVFSGGRFISTGEGIDTAEPGWELRVKVMELHNSTTIRELGHRVRRGQEGRVLDDGSAGDIRFGYESYYLDPNWADAPRRGPKPKKGVRIFEDEARWVRQVFLWFVVSRWSIGEIARELTRLGVPKGHRSSKASWHHEQIRRMLSCQKYIGWWPWGATTTIRNSKGRKKQIPVPAEQQQLRHRPDLRIIEQEVWDQAQRRLAELKELFGQKEGQKRRGPKVHPSEVYPRSLLGGLLVCGTCGTKLWYRGTGRRRAYACPAHRKGLCAMAAQVPAERAEEALTGFLTDLLCARPEWLGNVYQRTRELLQAALAEVPEQHLRDCKRLAEVERQITNLVAALAEGTLSSAAVKEKLAALEAEARQLRERIDGYEKLRQGDVALPDDETLAAELGQWIGALNGDQGRAAAVLRQAVGPVAAHAVLAPGKHRGYTQLRFRVRAWEALRAVLGDRLPDGLPIAVNEGGDAEGSPEFVLDLGQPTPMDRWAPQIAAWRAEDVAWEEIVRRTGLDLNRAFIAWKRFTKAQEDDTDAA